jgi:hypothetical protein
MTLPEIIYDIKRIISGGDTSADSKFIDAHLTQVVNQARAEALSVHYMQMREKRSLSEAYQEFHVLQNSGAFDLGTDATTDDHDANDDLESNSGNAADFGSQYYRQLKQYSVEASEGTVYKWDSKYENRKAPLYTDMCKFYMPSPVLKFGRNSGFLSFTDVSYDWVHTDGTSILNYNGFDAPGLGGDDVRVVYGMKELRDLQKHKASFPYKMGFGSNESPTTRFAEYSASTEDIYADGSYLTNPPDITSNTIANSGRWISFKNPIAVVSNSDIWNGGVPVTYNEGDGSNIDKRGNLKDAATLWGQQETPEEDYFLQGGQYNHNVRRKDAVLLLNSTIGRYLINDIYMNANRRFGMYLVSGIFADPTKLPNYNFKRSEYPIPQELLPQLKQNLITNQLMIAKRIEEDLINDGNDKGAPAQNVQPRQQAAGRQRSKA